MTEDSKKCMVCGQKLAVGKASICDLCQDRIRKEAMGEQTATTEPEELIKHGVTAEKIRALITTQPL